MSLILLLNPKQFGGEPTAPPDLSDVWYKLKKYQEEEEQIAAHLLKQRQENIEIPKTVNKDLLVDLLKDKLYATPKVGEVTGKTRIQRIKVLLMLLALEDE